MHNVTKELPRSTPRYLGTIKYTEFQQPDMELIHYMYRLKGQQLNDDVQLKLNDLSKVDRQRYELTRQFEAYERKGYKIYHLTVTYKKTEAHAYRTCDIYTFFENMYKQYLLKVMVGSHYNKPSKRAKQPMTLCFIDEHESKYIDGFAEHYHVHAMIAAHPDTVDNLDALLGEDTLDFDKIICHNIMTSYLSVPGTQCVLYASKMMWKHPDYLSFGGAVSSTH